ncbi:MAG: hypothetical protein H0X17_07410 [Deltaproteobacteria bacterium]|nr:hypothetical protein [Deltaproteobacteria bacterium]
MRAHILIVLLALARIASADPTIVAVSGEPAELARLWSLATASLDEPIGMRIDVADPVLTTLKLATGDVIRAVNGHSTHSTASPPEASPIYYLDVLRGTQTFTVRITVKYPAITELTVERAWLIDQVSAIRGNTFRPVLVQVRRAGKPSGVAVMASWPLFHGDVLRSIDGAVVTTLVQAANALDKSKDKPSVLVQLERLGKPLTFKLTIEKGLDDALHDRLDRGIKKIDDVTYEIDKSIIHDVVANPMASAKGARVVPAIKDGNPRGFKVYAIRQRSAYARLGFANGDTILSVNGAALVSPDAALEVYTQLAKAKRIVIELERRGKPVSLTFTIR